MLRLSLADKLHNVRSVLRDHRDASEDLWARFNAPDSAAVSDYYKSLAALYRKRCPGPMEEEFAAEVGRLTAAVEATGP